MTFAAGLLLGTILGTCLGALILGAFGAAKPNESARPPSRLLKKVLARRITM
jgi:hypothetical protein